MSRSSISSSMNQYVMTHGPLVSGMEASFVCITSSYGDNFVKSHVRVTEFRF